MNYTKAFLGGYLRTFYINWILKKNSKATDTQAQAFCCITQRLPWVASYLHFMLTGLLITVKCRRQASKGI